MFMESHVDKTDNLTFPKEEKEGVSICIVERDPFYKKFMEYSLKKITRFVEFMPDGVTALRRAKICKPDLFIYDPVSAKIRAADFCRWAREDLNLSSVPILVYSELDFEEEFGNEGNVRFLQKPFLEDDLLDVVTRLLPAVTVAK